MLRLPRRSVLRGVSFLAANALGTNAGFSASGSGSPDNGAATRLRGYVHALGSNASLFRDYQASQGKNASVVTTLNLKDGSLRQTLLEMREGHAAMSLGGGRILCIAQHRNKSIALDAEHRIIGVFVSPPLYVYGGHCLVMPGRGIFAMPMRHIEQRSINDVGRIQIYDLQSLKLLAETPSGGLQPHELHVIPGTDELALTHYGDIFVRRPPFEHNVIDAKLTILDAGTFRPKRHYPQPEFNALVTHMRVDKDGWAYFVLTQYIAWPSGQEVGGSEEAFSIATRELERAMGRKPEFPLPYHSWEERLFALPLPFVRVNTQTGERQIINAGDGNHLRSQSVAYSDALNAGVALYYHSDNIVVSTPGRSPEVIRAKEFGLRDIRGVTEIPGTPLIAVSGTYHGIAIMDLRDRELVAHHASFNYEDTHLYYDPAT